MKIAPPDLYGCTLYEGKLDRDGYGIVWRGPGSKPARAHRLVYEERHGPIPEGMEIEHACRRRACLTDAHHVLVGRSANEKLKRWRNRVKVAACPAGHDLFLDGMITPEGGRVCRRCSR